MDGNKPLHELYENPESLLLPPFSAPTICDMFSTFALRRDQTSSQRARAVRFQRGGVPRRDMRGTRVPDPCGEPTKQSSRASLDNIQPVSKEKTNGTAMSKGAHRTVCLCWPQRLWTEWDRSSFQIWHPSPSLPVLSVGTNLWHS